MQTISKNKQDYPFLLPIQTRWADNDMYGHVNNVTYYSYFDSAANALLIQHAGFDPRTANQIGLVISSSCQFLAEISYPNIIQVGVAIAKIGNSSLKYHLAIFQAEQNHAAAIGEFTHVFVDRQTRKSTPISTEMRHALTQFLIGEQSNIKA